jgi:hypothetical protein
MSRSGYFRVAAGPFKSLFPGICSVCSDPFPIGTPIARKGSGYCHLSCAPGGDES